MLSRAAFNPWLLAAQPAGQLRGVDVLRKNAVRGNGFEPSVGRIRLGKVSDMDGHEIHRRRPEISRRIFLWRYRLDVPKRAAGAAMFSQPGAATAHPEPRP